MKMKPVNKRMNKLKNKMKKTDMSGTIIFSIFERHKYNLMEIKYLEKNLNLNTLFLQLQSRNG